MFDTPESIKNLIGVCYSFAFTSNCASGLSTEFTVLISSQYNCSIANTYSPVIIRCSI